MTNKRLERFFVTLAVALLAFPVIPHSARVVTELIWPSISEIDPERVYLWISIHHVFQLAFTVLVMKFIFRMKFRDWGFNLNRLPESLRIFGWFALIYLVVVLLRRLPDLIAGVAPTYAYPLTIENMAGVMGFQFLLSGTGEEPLYRGLVMIVLGKYWTGVYRVGKVEIPTVGIIATILFMLAHVGISVSPLAITHFSLSQQLTAMGLGLYYAIVFHRTGSLVGPIISHGYSNAILFIIGYSSVLIFS